MDSISIVGFPSIEASVYIMKSSEMKATLSRFMYSGISALGML